MTPDEAITVVIPTSPIAINPSTEIIDETIAQVRKQIPGVRVITLMDGVHPEEMYLAERYREFRKKFLLRSARPEDVWEFNEWLHQTGMLRHILEYGVVETPFVLWTEHDIPLRDEPIDWQGIVDTLLEGKIGAIRFELTGDPPKRNEVVDHIWTHGIPLTLSTQYVNWPQVFRLDYLKEFISHFGNSKTYLECAEYDDIVKRLWPKWQYGIYSPQDEIRRCYHTNGRCAGGLGDPGKPFVEIEGKQRQWYSTPYKPLF